MKPNKRSYSRRHSRMLNRKMDYVFLTMEGIGQWVHFNTLKKKAPTDEPWQQTAQKFLAQTRSWTQWEEFASCVLIDREMPNWQSRVFAADCPSPFQIGKSKFQ